MVWEPKVCCCGATLRTGTMVLGWIGVIFNSLAVLALFGFVGFDPETIARTFNARPNEAEFIYQIGVGIVVVVALFKLFFIAVCASLIYGVHKGKEVLMLPYLIIQVVGLVICGLYALGYLITSLALLRLDLGMIVLIVAGPIYFLQVYLFLVVRACYLQVKKGVSGSEPIVYECQDDAQLERIDGYSVKNLV